MQIQPGEVDEAKKFIDTEIDRLIDWSVGDIKRCCRMYPNGTCAPDGPLVGSFILWISAIDYWGGIYTNCSAQRETTRRFREFVTKYMSNYDFEKLLDLRWALLHFYTSRHYALHQHNDINLCKGVHLNNSSHGIVLDLYCAISDLEDALNKYKADLNQSDELKVRLLRYFKTTTPMMPIKVSYISTTNPPQGGVNYSHNSAGTTSFPSSGGAGYSHNSTGTRTFPVN